MSIKLNKVKIPAAQELRDFYSLDGVSMFLTNYLPNLKSAMVHAIDNKRIIEKYERFSSKADNSLPWIYKENKEHLDNPRSALGIYTDPIIDYDEIEKINFDDKDLERFENSSVFVKRRFEFQGLATAFIVSGLSEAEQKFRLKSLLNLIERSIRLIIIHKMKRSNQVFDRVSDGYVKQLERGRQYLLEYFSDIYSDMKFYNVVAEKRNDLSQRKYLDFDTEIFESAEQFEKFEYLARHFIENPYNDYSFIYYKFENEHFIRRFTKQYQYYSWLFEKDYVTEEDFEKFNKKKSLDIKSVNRKRTSRYNDVLEKYSENQK
jgi:hypothetical protein